MKLEDNKQLKIIVDSAPIGICILSAEDLVAEMVNDKFLAIAGKTRESIIGKWYWESFAEARVFYQDALSGVISSGETYYADEVKLMLVRHGKEEWVFVTFVYAPVVDEYEQVSKVAVWVLENTTQVREREKVVIASQALQKDRDRLYDFFNTVPAGICILSGPELVYELVNPNYQALLPGRELLGRPIFQALPELLGTPLEQVLLDVFHKGTPAEFRDLLIPVAEQEKGITTNRFFTFNYVPRYNSEDKIDGIFAFVYEVTGILESKHKAERATGDLEQILSMLPASVVVIRGEELIVEMINGTNLDYWKKTRQEVIGRPFLEILPDLADQPFAGQLRRVMATGEVIDVKESPVLFAAEDGSIRETYVDYTYQPLSDPDGKRTGVLVMSFEVTDRVLKRRLLEKYAAELASANDRLSVSNNQLAKSESRFKYLISEAPVAIGVLHGRELVIESANAKILEVWGKSTAIVGMPLADALPEIQGQPFLELLDKVYTTGEPFYANEIRAFLEHQGQMKEIFFNVVYQPVTDITGSVADILVVAVDVTQQVNSRKKIEQSEQHFRQLADLVPAKISNALPTGEVTFFNKQWLDFGGMGFEDMRDFGYFKMMHPDEIPAFQAGLGRAAKEKVPYVSEMRFKNTSGTYIWHLNIASPVLDDNGAINMWVGSTTDIQSLKDEERRKGEFVSMLSHELKTPVTSIKGHVQLALRALDRDENSALGTKLRPSLSRIDRLLGQLTGLIGDMLDLTRIEAGRLDLRKVPFILDELVSEVVEDFRLSHQQHYFHLSLERGINVIADRDKISQVLINLIANAVKYAPSSDVVDIAVVSMGPEALISVRDYGIGIHEKDQQKIFERFYRVEGQNELHYSGFGIGLFLASSIMEFHEGRISLSSEKGKGSTFTIHLQTGS
jgi:two-component system sensor histidine kinase VicK